MNQDLYSIGNFFPPTDCISQDVMIAYAEGKLPREASRMVELHLVDCPLCSDALEGIMLVGTQSFAAMAEEVSEGVEARLEESTEEQGKIIEFRPNINPPRAAASPSTAKGGFSLRKSLPFFSIAASVVLVISFCVFFYLGDSAAKIADTQFEMNSFGSRGAIEEAPTEPLDEGKALYDAKDFQKAATIFDKEGSRSSALYAGDCYYQLGSFDLAVIRFKKAMDADNGLEGEAEFKLALTYLRQDEVAQARILLEKISKDPTHTHVRQANRTLEDVLGL